jgi:hypothetical protein
MIKSKPNAGRSAVTYISEVGFKCDLKTCKNFITESRIYTHGCNEQKSLRFELYMSENDTSTVPFEMFEDRYREKLRAENLLASPLSDVFQESFEIKCVTILGPEKNI